MRWRNLQGLRVSHISLGAAFWELYLRVRGSANEQWKGLTGGEQEQVSVNFIKCSVYQILTQVFHRCFVNLTGLCFTTAWCFALILQPINLLTYNLWASSDHKGTVQAGRDKVEFFKFWYWHHLGCLKCRFLGATQDLLNRSF